MAARAAVARRRLLFYDFCRSLGIAAFECGPDLIVDAAVAAQAVERDFPGSRFLAPELQPGQLGDGLVDFGEGLVPPDPRRLHPLRLMVVGCYDAAPRFPQRTEEHSANLGHVAESRRHAARRIREQLVYLPDCAEAEEADHSGGERRYGEPRQELGFERAEHAVA